MAHTSQSANTTYIELLLDCQAHDEQFKLRIMINAFKNQRLHGIHLSSMSLVRDLVCLNSYRPLVLVRSLGSNSISSERFPILKRVEARSTVV